MFFLTKGKCDPSEDDRVRRNTPCSINQRIDEKTENNIARFRDASQDQKAQRIRKLDREWDIERLLELNASTLALTGLILGVMKDRRWLAVPGVVLPFLLQHSVQGWCPPLPILRALGIRTRQEIDREKYALMGTNS